MAMAGGSEVVIKTNVKVHYVFKERLGEGSHGVIHLAEERSTGLLRAVKKIRKRAGLDVSRFRRELEVLIAFRHPQIVKVFGAYEDHQALYIIMEHCRGGDLCDKLEQEGPFSESVAAFFMKQAFSAVAACHAQGIMHRDVKLENFLFLDSDMRSPLKLTDFGLCRYFNTRDAEAQTLVGTLNYLAPEVLTLHYSHEADLWSLGVLMYLLLTDSFPFAAPTETGVLKAIQTAVIPFKNNVTPLSKAARDLINSLCRKNPEERISARDALKHPWIRMLNPSPLTLLPKLFQDGRVMPSRPSFCCDLIELGPRHSRRCHTVAHQSTPNARPKSEQNSSERVLRRVRSSVSRLGVCGLTEAQDLGHKLVDRWQAYQALSPTEKKILTSVSRQVSSLEASYLGYIYDLLDTEACGAIRVEALCRAVSFLCNCTELRAKSEVKWVESDDCARKVTCADSEESSSEEKVPTINWLDDQRYVTVDLCLDIESPGWQAYLAMVNQLKALAFEHIDINKNGLIEVDEFCAACMDHIMLTKPIASKILFNSLKVNQASKITIDDFLSAFGTATPAAIADEPDDDILSNIDPDGDGLIEEGNLEALLCRSAACLSRGSNARLCGDSPVADTNIDSYAPRDALDFRHLVRGQGSQTLL